MNEATDVHIPRCLCSSGWPGCCHPGGEGVPGGERGLGGEDGWGVKGSCHCGDVQQELLHMFGWRRGSGQGYFGLS